MLSQSSEDLTKSIAKAQKQILDEANFTIILYEQLKMRKFQTTFLLCLVVVRGFLMVA
jgi:hypothetical protein